MRSWVTPTNPSPKVPFILMVFLLVALMAGVVWLARTNEDGPFRHRASAIGQLEERYAQGEIDRDDYFERRKDLERR